jgi:hypothetical protein
MMRGVGVIDELALFPHIFASQSARQCCQLLAKLSGKSAAEKKNLAPY